MNPSTFRNWLTVLTLIVLVLAVTAIKGCMDVASDDPDPIPSQRTAKRVDRLSFFNVADRPDALGDPSMVTAEIRLCADPEGEQVWKDVRTELLAWNRQPAAHLVLQELEEGEPGPFSAVCAVPNPKNQEEVLECLVKAPGDLWIVSVTFWYGPRKEDGPWLCGEALLSDGTIQTHERVVSKPKNQ